MRTVLTGFLGVVLVLLSGTSWAEIVVQNQRVTIDVQGSSLTEVLTEVARQAGATIQVDPKVEHQVSVRIKNLPMQRAMDQVARQEGLNIVLGWRRNSEGQDYLTSIDVLPDGNMKLSDLEREDAKRQRILQQQQKERKGGRAIVGGAEDKSGWGKPMAEQRQE